MQHRIRTLMILLTVSFAWAGCGSERDLPSEPGLQIDGPSAPSGLGGQSSFQLFGDAAGVPIDFAGTVEGTADDATITVQTNLSGATDVFTMVVHRGTDETDIDLDFATHGTMQYRTVGGGDPVVLGSTIVDCGALESDPLFVTLMDLAVALQEKSLRSPEEDVMKGLSEFFVVSTGLVTDCEGWMRVARLSWCEFHYSTGYLLCEMEPTAWLREQCHLENARTYAKCVIQVIQDPIWQLILVLGGFAPER